MSEIAFDEAGYLKAYPDVAEAVRIRRLESGLAHYEKFGKREGRMGHSFDGMSREDKALSQLDIKGLGLEIGPSHNPVAPKTKGFNVHILDYLDAEALRNKYRAHDVKLENIEDVDYVWSGESLPELIGKRSYYDFIIASHVIEHVPDFISFLQQCEELLKPDGRLSLIVPDKRYCFDYFNSNSSTGELLDAYEEKRIRPSVGKVFDHFANACKKAGGHAWTADTKGELEFIYTTVQSQSLWHQARNGNEYIDVHCWRFTPESFHLILADLHSLQLIGLGVIKEFKTTGCEFYVTLGKAASPPTANRLQMLQQSKASDV